MAGRKRKRQKNGFGVIRNSISAIVICAALVFGISVFFRVSEIEVRGVSRYSASEVVEASGVKEGSSIVFLNRAAVESRISESLTYAGKITVSRKLPNTVVIEINESGTVACIETESGTWLIDSYCKLLEECPNYEVESYMKVTGFVALSPKAGTRITLSAEDKAKVDYLEEILLALQNAGMLKDVSGIDMSNGGNPQLEYFGRFRVKLGRNDAIESKLAILKDAVANLEEGSTGVFDLSKPKEAYFSPD